jgi:hypothetical protein
LTYRSILQQNTDECFYTGKTYGLEWHHVFPGALKKKSEYYGLMIRVNHDEHNEPPNGIHFNKARREALQAYAQEVFESTYPDLNFMELFYKNYR